MIVQIYGITTAEDAALVNEIAPDNVGVVLDEGFDAWDSIDERTIRQVLLELDRVDVVALSLAITRDQILKTLEITSPKIVHLVRALGGMSTDAIRSLREEIAPVQLMLTIPVDGPEAIQTAIGAADLADYLLLDSRSPTTGIVGASGLAHDWSLSQQIVEMATCPSILAGGLGPDNVQAAIAAVQPLGVDSETLTSRVDDRRRKDPRKVREFVERARSNR